jgi:hypothetical protein
LLGWPESIHDTRNQCNQSKHYAVHRTESDNTLITALRAKLLDALPCNPNKKCHNSTSISANASFLPHQTMTTIFNKEPIAPISGIVRQHNFPQTNVATYMAKNRLADGR